MSCLRLRPLSRAFFTDVPDVASLLSVIWARCGVASIVSRWSLLRPHQALFCLRACESAISLKNTLNQYFHTVHNACLSMELDFWWLLAIPAILGIGWISARLDLKHLLADNSALPRSYFRGLNFLLREQHAQPIDAFIEAAIPHPEATELPSALANLFRRRGETGRAI